MRNAVQRRNHRERSQLSSRLRYGHLEKHRDYALRAADYNSKKKRLKILKTKAAERNPDEFYFGMVNAKTRDGGVFVKERGGNTGAMGMEVVRGLKMQDKGYLRVMGDVERRKREKLEEELVFVDVDGTGNGVGMGTKKVFDENGEVIKPVKEKRKKRIAMDNDEEMNWEDDEEEEEEKVKLSQEESKVTKARMTKYKELEARMKREAELRVLERELDAQRLFMGKSSPRMGLTKEGKRWFNTARKK
ncbi:hypothetical protein ABW20_dc0107648 [Dactylellina cionopaga]|nr:hypothetical protein ABW20_dc0107648 [Dactylellina cionopaga]